MYECEPNARLLNRWQARFGRARVSSSVATWFSPARWSQYDMIIAVVSLVLAISLFTPWFQATVHFRHASVSGFLISPPGTVNGITVHGYLWLVFGLALLQFAVLAARYGPNRRGFTLPGYRHVLIVLSTLSAIAVLVACVMKPNPWYGGNDLAGGLIYIVVGWTYGAVVALAAAIISLGFAVAAIRDHSSLRASR